MADISIGIVASSREWRTILQAHVRDHVAGIRVQILREPRLALELDLDVVIIDDTSSFLTKDKVVRLREKGTRVVGIYDTEEQEGLGQAFLEKLGIDLALPSTISPEEMINSITQLQPRANYSQSFDQIVDNYSGQASQYGNVNNSIVISVGGPPGVGSTEIAIAIADALTVRKESTLLIDCDEVGPSVARRLGYHLHPNILTAVDAVSNATNPLPQVVGRPSDRAANAIYFDVIPGIANLEDWSQLRSSEINDLFNAIKKSWRYCVADTGPLLEDLSGYGMERFASSRTTCENSQIIVGVMSPTPTGYLRFLDWMASIRTLANENAIAIVINNAPKSAYVRGEIESQIVRDIDSKYIASINFVPIDENVAKANWEGQRVTKSPFSSAVAQLVNEIVPSYVASAKSKSASVPVVTSQNTYVPGPSASAPAGVSWDDEDIINPNINPQLSAQVTPQVVVPPPVVQTPVVPMVPAPVQQSPSIVNPEPTQQERSSFGAPQTNYVPQDQESNGVWDNPTPNLGTNPMPNIASPKYVPSFAKDAQAVSPADKIDDALSQPNQFLDEYGDDDTDTDDGRNKFWSP